MGQNVYHGVDAILNQANIEAGDLIAWDKETGIDKAIFLDWLNTNFQYDQYSSRGKSTYRIIGILQK